MTCCCSRQLQNLEEIGGNFQVQSNPKLKNLYLPKTQGTGLYNGDYKSRQPGDVTITRNGDLKLIYAPKLEAGQSIPSSYLYFDGVPRAAAADMIDETALDNPQGNAANGKLETSAFTDKRRMNSAKMSIAFNDKLKAAVLPRSPYTIYSLGDQKTGLIVLKPGNQSPPFPPQYGTMDEGPEPSGFY